MRRNPLLLLLMIGIIAPLAGMFGVRAQEEAAPPVFGPRDVLPLFFRSLRVADIFLLQDGSVASAIVKNTEFTLDGQTLKRDEIIAIFFGDEDAGESDRVYLTTGERLTGELSVEHIEAELAFSQQISLASSMVKGVFFKLRAPSEGQHPAVFRQLFGFFNALLVSVTKFDTLVFPDGRLASVMLEDRDRLAFTIDSSIFGTFTFTPTELAWVIFGQGADQPDQVALKNGDRVSGTVTAHGGLQGTLASGEIAFTLSQEQLRQQLRQIIFQIPVRFFGGGGQRPKPTPD